MTEEELNAARGNENRPGGPGEESNTAIDEQDLFGALSDSDEDINDRKEIDIDSEGETSNAMFESESQPGGSSSSQAKVTEFSKDMFPAKNEEAPEVEAETEPQPSTSGQSVVALKLESLRKETDQLKTKKSELENNIANCDNLALQQRFQETLMEVEKELRQKENEMEDLSMFS